jgi:3-oxoacyl-[acyl-carrier protein] reductase
MKSYILITGGTGGIGSALALSLKKLNFLPIVTFRKNKDRADEIVHKTGGESFYLDLSDEKSISDIINHMNSKKLNIEGTVLAASFPLELKPFKEVSTQDMKNHFVTSVTGHGKLLSLLIQNYFKANRRGKVIGILSEAMGVGDTANLGMMSHYIVSKYALMGLLKALKKENNYLEINTISPGFTNTEMLRNAFDERFLEILRKDNKISEPQEVAEMILEQLQ